MCKSDLCIPEPWCCNDDILRCINLAWTYNIPKCYRNIPRLCIYYGNSPTVLLLYRETVETSGSSYLISWLYFDKRSDLQGAPVLI